MTNDSGSGSLLLLDFDRLGLVELRRQPLAGALAQGLFDELAGFLAGRAGEAFGRDGGFACWATR